MTRSLVPSIIPPNEKSSARNVKLLFAVTVDKFKNVPVLAFNAILFVVVAAEFNAIPVATTFEEISIDPPVAVASKEPPKEIELLTDMEPEPSPPAFNVKSPEACVLVIVSLTDIIVCRER